eukprot:TRINITY_DN2884_c0_g2_i1.p3 TRINITY_DN2884_c0_g2~~TRINITY_DN2884_c0_g2_i1.p3  ORF type:complete len:106 (-),score=11.17 TRINITY_DN2884_c0_g2_i1:249-566(-)
MACRRRPAAVRRRAVAADTGEGHPVPTLARRARCGRPGRPPDARRRRMAATGAWRLPVRRARAFLRMGDGGAVERRVCVVSDVGGTAPTTVKPHATRRRVGRHVG